MKLKNLLLSTATAAILSSCASLQMQKIYTKKISSLLELAVEKNLAKVDSVPNARRIRLDLNPLDNKDPKKRGIHKENQPSLYNLFGVDELIYLDLGKKGYSEEDTLITNVSSRHPNKYLIAQFTLKDAKTYKNGIPIMNNKCEIMYGIYAIKERERKNWVPPHEEYYRFMNEVENFLENKLIEVKEKGP